jgi:hypothetical protein
VKSTPRREQILKREVDAKAHAEVLDELVAQI